MSRVGIRTSISWVIPILALSSCEGVFTKPNSAQFATQLQKMKAAGQSAECSNPIPALTSEEGATSFENFFTDGSDFPWTVKSITIYASDSTTNSSFAIFADRSSLQETDGSPSAPKVLCQSVATNARLNALVEVPDGVLPTTGEFQTYFTLGARVGAKSSSPVSTASLLGNMTLSDGQSVIHSAYSWKPEMGDPAGYLSTGKRSVEVKDTTLLPETASGTRELRIHSVLHNTQGSSPDTDIQASIVYTKSN